MCLQTSLSQILSVVSTVKLVAETPWALFPAVHSGGHTTNAVGVVSQTTGPAEYKHGARKHLLLPRNANLTNY
jgi:hypothetical protein